jgi:hypothetical protein
LTSRLDTLLDRLHAQKLMSSRRFATWQKVAAFAPLLLLAVALPSQSLLRCRIDGFLRSSCCCPAEAKAETERALPVVKAQDCCDREGTLGERPVIAPIRTSSVDTAWTPSIAVSAPSVYFSFAAPDRSQRVWQAQGPPRQGPPIVLLKHAFLI